MVLFIRKVGSGMTRGTLSLIEEQGHAVELTPHWKHFCLRFDSSYFMVQALHQDIRDHPQIAFRISQGIPIRIVSHGPRD